MTRRLSICIPLALVLAIPGTGALAEDADALRARAKTLFGTLPDSTPKASNPITEPKVTLGRMLYYDTRLSKNQDISCNSCHLLGSYGVDGEPTSPGHRGQRGDRNSPTVYNAGLHLAQFWDGRAPDLEAQAKGPVLNPVEMAMPDEASVLTVLGSIPGYVEGFAAAFPGTSPAITYDHFADAVGAFERTLTTPGPFDRWLEGDDAALDEAQLGGLSAFLETGCTTCHVGPAVGGTMYQKLGLVVPYPTEDPGRMAVTGNETDRGFFKVPSLRNIAKTGPYFHDGSIETLPEAVRLMAHHQLGQELDDAKIASITAFLEALTGELPEDRIAKPELPASGPTTPAPDPS